MNRRAFTFIEILLVTALVASLSLAVFTCLSSGLKLWERSRATILAEDIVIFFDKISGDLRNTFLFSTLAFDGSEYAVAFPTVVWTKADRLSARSEEGMIDQLGRARYAFDPSTNVVTRQQANYSSGIKGDWEQPQVLVRSVKELRFRYYYQGQKDYRSTAQGGEVLPSGVDVQVIYTDKGSEISMHRFIAIPAGL